MRRAAVWFGLALLGMGCAAPEQAAGPVASAASPAALAAFPGRWTGTWNAGPEYTTELRVESVSPDGWVVGSYVFQSLPPSPFRARIEGNAFSFGQARRFTFTLRPDGRLDGLRVGGSEMNTTVLTRI
jgi:hypothetical protein